MRDGDGAGGQRALPRHVPTDASPRAIAPLITCWTRVSPSLTASVPAKMVAISFCAMFMSVEYAGGRGLKPTA